MKALIQRLAMSAALTAGVAAPSDASETSVLGTLKCLGPAGGLLSLQDCDPATAEYLLESEDGRVWQFVPDDPRTGIFSEPRVRHQRLHVIGRPAGGRLETIDLHIVRSDGHFLPHYHCDVCNVTAYAPGPCWCCQQPFEFRLRPVPGETDSKERP